MTIKVTDTIVTTSPSDTYPTHLAELGKGGFRSVELLTQLQTIPTSRRESGMLVYVQQDQIVYQLSEDLVTWKQFILSTEQLQDVITAISLIQVDAHNTDENAHIGLIQSVTIQADRATAAADIAQLNAGIYSNITTALPLVQEGRYFSIPSMDNAQYLILYQKQSGLAVEIKKYPSSYAIDQLIDLTSKPNISNYEFEGMQPLTYNPIIVSGDGSVVLQMDDQGLLDLSNSKTSDTTTVTSKLDWSAEFHSTTTVAFDVALVTEDGSAILSWNELGMINLNNTTSSNNNNATATNSTWSAEFYTTEPTSFDVALVTEDGSAILTWDDDGILLTGKKEEIVSTYLPTEMLPYIENNTTIRAVGATDVIAGDVQPFNIIGTYPSIGHVRAIIDRPAISNTMSVAVMDNLLIPDTTQTLHVIIGLGQSLMVGSQSSDSMISINPVWPDDCLMFTRLDNLSDVRLGLVTADGGSGAQVLNESVLVDFEPLITKMGVGSGNRGQTPMESLATTLSTTARNIGARFKSLSFTAALGGTAYSGLKKGTQTYTNMLVALQKAKLLAEQNGMKIIVDACLVKHGEADQSNSNYLANLLEWQTDITNDVKAITNQQATVHFLMAQPSTHNSTTPRATMAMVSAHLTSPYHHLTGSDYAFNDTYATDELHLTGPGYYWVGEMMAQAWKDVLWTGKQKSNILLMTSVIRNGTTVTITYNVPHPPLMFDTISISERDVKGFRFFNGNTQITINSATIVGQNQVVLELNALPDGINERVDYAMSPQSSTRSPQNRVRGNLRDNSTLISTYNNRRLYNWAVSQSFSL